MAGRSERPRTPAASGDAALLRLRKNLLQERRARLGTEREE
ncbi:hypothetical protein [Streptomyces collinus]